MLDDDKILETRIRDLKLDFFMGVLPEEKLKRQPVLINVSIYTLCDWRHDSDDLDRYVSYADVVEGIRALAAAGQHVALVETLAEKICDLSLRDQRVVRVRTTVEKTAIIPEAAAVGVTVQRSRHA